MAMDYTFGHGDIGIAFEEHHDVVSLDEHDHDDEFFFHWHLGADSNLGEGEHEASEITAVVPSSRESVVQNDAPFNNMTGAAPGSSIWTLPQNEVGGVPFLGIATEELSSDDFPGLITFSLDSVTSPSGSGEFSLWQTDGFGAFDFYFSTNNPAGTENENNNTFQTTAGTHSHFNWGFTEPGMWILQMTVSGTHAVEGNLSATESFAFNVVPEPSTYAIFAGLGALAICVLRRRQK